MIAKSIKSHYVFLIATSLFLLSGCGKERKEKKIKAMTFQDHKEKVVAALKGKKRSETIPHLERMIEEYPEDQHVSEYRLTLADLYFEEGKKYFDHEPLQAAYNLYKKFYTFNPSDPKAEYASYKAILATFYQTNRIECDSLSYDKAVTLCKKHLQKPEFQKGYYCSDVRDVLYTCERKLIDKEIYIFNSNLRQGKEEGAAYILERITQQYSSEHTDLEPRLKYLAFKLARYKEEKDNVQGILKELEEYYPDSEYTLMAQNALHKNGN